VSREELEGVLAHELAHVKNRDMLLQTVTGDDGGSDQQHRVDGMFAGGRDDDEGATRSSGC
jgi:heat shock protein HtpX